MLKDSIKKPIIIALILIGALLLAFLLDAGVTLIEKKVHPLEYKEIIEKYATEYNIPEYVVLSVINTESSFEPEAMSGAGAMGLMQMMPETFKWLTSSEHLDENLSVSSIYDPEVSIRYGCYYLRYLFQKFYNWDTVFAAYNGGEGNVAKWLANPEYSDGKGNLTHIPFKETRNYVKKVNREIEYYKNTYYQNEVSVK